MLSGTSFENFISHRGCHSRGGRQAWPTGYLFGSRVLGDARPGGAIAIAVELDLEELIGRDDTSGVHIWLSESAS